MTGVLAGQTIGEKAAAVAARLSQGRKDDLHG